MAAATERRNGSSAGSAKEGRVGASSGAKVRHAREDAAASSSDEQDKALLLRPRGNGAADEEQEQQLRPRGNGAADEEQEQQSSTSSSEEEEQRVELFGSDPEQTWWHYKLSVELYLTAFFFAFSGGFTNVVYLIRYGVFSSVPMGNFIRLGVVISEAFADRLRDLKQDLGREEYAQAKVVAKFAGPEAFISVLVGAILANAFGGLLAHWAMEASERNGGVFLAGLAILLEGGAWWHYQSVYRVLGGDHPSADKCFPLGVLLGAASGGAQNYFTGMGPMRVNTVGLTGVLQRVPPLIVDKLILDDAACFGALQCRCCTRAKKPAKLLQMSPTQRSQSTRVSAASTVAEAEAERLRLPCYSSESRVFSYMYALVPLGMLCGVAVAGYLHTRPQFATSLWPPFITLVPLVLCYLVHDFVLLQPEKHTESGDLLSLEQVKAKCRMERRRAAHRERAARRGRVADGKHHGKKAHDDHENRSAVESAAADVVRDAAGKKNDTSEESGSGADQQNEKKAGSRYHAHQHHTSSAATTSAGARRSRKSSSRIEPAGTGFKEPQLKLTLMGSTKENKNTEQ